MGGRSGRNFGGENAPVPDDLARIRLKGTHLVRALPGWGRPRASQASVPDRANETGLAPESLIDYPGVPTTRLVDLLAGRMGAAVLN